MLSKCTLPRPGMLVEEVVENAKIVVSTGQGSTGLINVHLTWVKSTMVHTAIMFLCSELKSRGAASELLMRCG